MGVMAEYKAFFFNQKQHIDRGEDFEASDDEAALKHATQWVSDDATVDVWSQGVFVGIVRTKNSKTNSRGHKMR